MRAGWQLDDLDRLRQRQSGLELGLLAQRLRKRQFQTEHCAPRRPPRREQIAGVILDDRFT